MEILWFWSFGPTVDISPIVPVPVPVLYSQPQGWTWTPRKRNPRDLRFETWGSIFQPFFWIGTKYHFGSFFVPASPLQFLWGPAGYAKVPAEVPEDCRVLRARRLCTQLPIASTPGSSSLEWPGLDDTTSQPWSDATCTCNTASITLSCLFQQKERDKAEVSTSKGGTGAICVRPWLTRDIV